MPLSDIVQVTITAETTTPSQVGFGTPCILAYHTVYPERVRQYSSTGAMITDGFTATDPAYLCAQAIFAQNPSPPTILVGRTDNDEKMKIEIYPSSTDVRASFDYKFYVNGVLAKYTSDSTPAVAEITAGLTAAIDPAAWVTTTAYVVGDHVTNDTGPVKNYICTTAGTSGATGPTGTGSGITDGTCVWDYVGTNQPVTATDGTTKVTVEADTVADGFSAYAEFFDLLRIQDITPDGSPNGIVEDLTQIRNENDDFYFICPTNKGKPVLTALAAHVETLTKLMVVSTADGDTIDATVTDDIISNFQTAGYDRSPIKFHPKSSLQYAGAAWTGVGAPKDPGSITWKFKTLSGVDYTDLSDTQVSTLQGKNGNMYIRLAGVSFTQEGVSPSGEFIDITRGIDFITARIQEFVFARLVNNDKIPYTNPGIATIEAEVKAVLQLAVNNQILAADPAPETFVPDVADVTTADKANRILRDVKFQGTLAGAIHKVIIQGTVSV
jgi:hypothetical protein